MGIKDVEITKEIKTVKNLKDANDDLRKLDEILEDSHKFRQQSNTVYHRIVGNPEYSQYIAIARETNKIKPGNTSFEKVSDYVLRRKIISMLRQAVSAYIIAEITKQEQNKTNEEN